MDCYSGFHWYYFDLHDTGGYDLICTIHPRPFNSCFEIAIIDIYLYQRDTVVFHHFFVMPQKDWRTKRSPFRLYAGEENRVVKENGNILVELKDERCRLHLELVPAGASTALPECALLADPEPGHHFNWKVFEPYCNGRAEVTFDDRSWKLSGRGYHDFNSGTVNLKKELTGWFWGKFYTADSVTVLGVIEGRSSGVSRLVLQAGEKGACLDDKAVVEGDKSELSFRSKTGSGRFTMEAPVLLDEIRFFMASVTLPGFVVKMIEMAVHLCGRLTVLRPIHKWLSNARYCRYRATGRDEKDRPVFCFFEEMYF